MVQKLAFGKSVSFLTLCLSVRLVQATLVHSGQVLLKAIRLGRSYQLLVTVMYTVVYKKCATLFLTITPMFHGGFLYLLYQCKHE